MEKIAFIGGGNMAGAMIRSLIDQACYPASQVYVFDPNETCCQSWREAGVHALTQAGEALRECQLVVLAVKPQVMAEVLPSYRPFLKQNVLLISVAAGISVASLKKQLGELTDQIVRVMPNTPTLVGQGAAGYYAPNITRENLTKLQVLLNALGVYVACEQESLIDAVTALSGSGPAYVFLFIEALIEGAKQLGLSEQEAKGLALQTLKGSVALLESSGERPATLREKVTSKGGTTAAALGVFQEREFKTIVQDAMKAAFDRSRELSKAS